MPRRPFLLKSGRGDCSSKRAEQGWLWVDCTQARTQNPDVCFKARYVCDFFKFKNNESDEEEARSFDPELYDPLAATIQRCYRRYRRRMNRRVFLCAKMAMQWRGRRKLKLRRKRNAHLVRSRKEADRLFVQRLESLCRETVREWRKAALAIKKAKRTWKVGLAYLVIRHGLNGWYKARARKNRLKKHIEDNGEPEVQGALAVFLADGDWARCVGALDACLRRYDASEVSHGGYCNAIAGFVRGTRLELADPDLQPLPAVWYVP